jgi:hypothetical protein
MARRRRSKIWPSRLVKKSRAQRIEDRIGTIKKEYFLNMAHSINCFEQKTKMAD